MDHKIISWILKLRLHTLRKHWRILITFFLVIWLIVAVAIPGIFVIIPLLLIVFTWNKPNKKNIKKVIGHRKRITFYLQKFLGIYRNQNKHFRKRHKKKIKGKK